MAQYAYSPDTGELIRTDNPADWMGATSVAPPEFDPATAGCFWRGDHWEIVPGEVPSDPVPKVVTMRQARLALLQMGNLDAAEAAIDSIPDATLRRAAQIEWEYAQGIERNSPLVQQVVSALQINDQQLDDLFALAGSL